MKSIKLTVGLLCIAVLGMGFYIAQNSSRIDRLEKRVLMLRSISVGRSKDAVIKWMGKPNKILSNLEADQKVFPEVFVYGSTLPNSEKLNGSEDLWVAFDENGRVDAVFYPDFAQEKAIVPQGQ